jgi:hypothetical protein
MQSYIVHVFKKKISMEWNADECLFSILAQWIFVTYMYMHMFCRILFDMISIRLCRAIIYHCWTIESGVIKWKKCSQRKSNRKYCSDMMQHFTVYLGHLSRLALFFQLWSQIYVIIALIVEIHELLMILVLRYQIFMKDSNEPDKILFQILIFIYLHF